MRLALLLGRSGSPSSPEFAASPSPVHTKVVFLCTSLIETSSTWEGILAVQGITGAGFWTARQVSAQTNRRRGLRRGSQEQCVGDDAICI